MSEVRRRDRSGPAGSSGESLRAREERSRRDGSLGEGRGRRREKTRRRKRERGRGRRRRGRKGPARESGTEPKSVHCLGDSILSRRMLFGKGVSAMESSQSVWLGGLGFGGLQGSPRRREEQPRERYSAERSKSPKGGEVCRRFTASRHRVWQLCDSGEYRAKAGHGCHRKTGGYRQGRWDRRELPSRDARSMKTERAKKERRGVGEREGKSLVRRWNNCFSLAVAAVKKRRSRM